MASLMPLIGQKPGITAISAETTTKVVWWGREERLLFAGRNIVGSAAVDAGSSPTTLLRTGLVMGVKTSDGLWYACDPNATTGIEVPAGILLADLSMLGASGSAEDKFGIPILLSGPVKAADLLIEGTLLTSSSDEFYVRTRLAAKGFIFDDDFQGKLTGPFLHNRELIVTGDTTVTAADNGTLFVVTGSSGATTFTLPTFERGLSFEFLQLDDQNMAVASAGSSDNIIGKNDAAADSLTFSTANNKVGAHCRVRSLEVVNKWMVDNLCDCTITMA